MFPLVLLNSYLCVLLILCNIYLMYYSSYARPLDPGYKYRYNPSCSSDTDSRQSLQYLYY